jgi:hypothetical protein
MRPLQIVATHEDRECCSVLEFETTCRVESVSVQEETILPIPQKFPSLCPKGELQPSKVRRKNISKATGLSIVSEENALWSCRINERQLEVCKVASILKGKAGESEEIVARGV